jgi:transcriptional regulator with XRE-family HTH domain
MSKKNGVFAARLRELRKAAGLTQAELATKAGLHLHGLTKLEHGDREPSWGTIQALADALAVTVDELRGPPASASLTQPGRGRPVKPKRRLSAIKRPRGRPPKKSRKTV